MPTEQQTETRREIAERTAEKFRGRFVFPAVSVPSLADAIEAALNAQAERAARIAKNPYGDEVQAVAGDEPKAVGEKIARAILSEDHK